MHFKLIGRVLENFGFHIELLTEKRKQVAQTGLKYVHNDTCYPALLVIGQFINALQSGKYDVNKTALIMFQTGGGCRASNYISLIRKALRKAGMEPLLTDLEQPFARVLSGMEQTGFMTDREALMRLDEKFTARISELLTGVREIAGNSFNP